MRFLVDSSLPRSAAGLLRYMSMNPRMRVMSGCAALPITSSPPTLSATGRR
jgi:hypothetical protein